MAKFNLSHANFDSQVKPSPAQPAAPSPMVTPSPKNLPIKRGEREGGIACHEQWKEEFLGGGEYISIPLRRKGGGMLKIPRIEIVRCMEKLYQSRMLIDPSESQQGIYEEAKKIVVSRYLKKEEIVKKDTGKKHPKPSWVNPKYR